MRCKVPKRQPASFYASALYLAGYTKGHTPDRVAWVIGHNLETTHPRAAAAVMDATAARSQRCPSPAYHFIITFDPNDAKAGRVNEDIMRTIAGRAIEHLELQRHQALIYAHRDTDHPHMHFLVNRIQAESGKAWSREQDFVRLKTFARTIATEFGLNVPRDRVKEREFYKELDDEVAEMGPLPHEGEFRQARKEKRPAAVPFDATALAALRERLPPAFHDATTWDDLAGKLGAQGLFLRRKGQGLVITDGARFCKLSDMGKDIRLPKLEGRFSESFERFVSRSYLAQEQEDDGRTPRDPVAQLDQADAQWQAWSTVEASYTHREKAVAKGRTEVARLKTRAERADAREAKAHERLMPLFRTAFLDGERAARTWKRLEEDLGEQRARELVRRDPNQLGEMRGVAVYQEKSAERRAAERAFHMLAFRRDRWRQALRYARVIRQDLDDARRKLENSRKELEFLTATKSHAMVRQMVIEKANTRRKALERVSRDLVLASSLADERKKQLLDAAAQAQSEQRRRAREREKERELARSPHRPKRRGLGYDIGDD